MKTPSFTPTPLFRKALAEFLGAGFLLAAIVGSGIAATRMVPGNPGLQLLVNSLATGAILCALILALQPISAAFNPAVTIVELCLRVISRTEATTLIAAQVVGGAIGAILANLMFGLPAVTISEHARTGVGLWLGEVIATTGLILVIFGTVRTGRSSTTAFAVGGYITAAIWFTSATSFANPAVTISRMFSDSFAGIMPSSVAMFIVMQLVGAAIALILIRAMYPEAQQLAEGLVDEHDDTDSHTPQPALRESAHGQV